MDEAYAQRLIDWMDGEGGYRAWYAAQQTAPHKTGGPVTDMESGDNGPPPAPPR